MQSRNSMKLFVSIPRRQTSTSNGQWPITRQRNMLLRWKTLKRQLYTLTRDRTRTYEQQLSSDEGEVLPELSNVSLALSLLDRPADAKFCIDLAVRDGCKDKSIPIWQGKIDRATEGRSETATVSEIPESIVTTKTDTVMGPSAPIPSMTAPPKKPNFDWYQNDKDVIVTFYARNVPADKCKLEIQAQSVSVIEMSLMYRSRSSFHYLMSPRTCMNLSTYAGRSLLQSLVIACWEPKSS